MTTLEQLYSYLLALKSPFTNDYFNYFSFNEWLSSPVFIITSVFLGILLYLRLKKVTSYSLRIANSFSMGAVLSFYCLFALAAITSDISWFGGGSIFEKLVYFFGLKVGSILILGVGLYITTITLFLIIDNDEDSTDDISIKWYFIIIAPLGMVIVYICSCILCGLILGVVHMSNNDNISFYANNTIYLILFYVVIFMIYIIPSFIANKRKHHNKIPIFLTNILLGFTIIGWIVALIWSFTNPPHNNIKSDN